MSQATSIAQGSTTETVCWLRPAFTEYFPELLAGFSLRHGGVSLAPFATLNLGMSTGDRPEHVQENRRRLAEAVGFEVERLTLAGQVHGAKVRVVHASGLYPGYDALVTKADHLILGITAADCAVVLLYDPAHRVLAACHAGWRGTVGGVVAATVAAMQELEARPDSIWAYVSPCIGLTHFEVGEEVAAQFEPEVVHRRPEWPRPHVDLKQAVVRRLQQVGIPETHIEVAPQDTAACTAQFFSYRAEQGRTGRMLGFIGRRV
ncbi:MAG: peptidoglycan editing factor PgeF [Rhodothermus sp.]|nr:peptidoglycan editing factor PgeF [Rhodothermus sp.]